MGGDGTEIIEVLDVSFAKYDPIKVRTASGNIKYGFKLVKKILVTPQPVSMNMLHNHAKQSLREQEPGNLLKISKKQSNKQLISSSNQSS